MLVSFCPGWDLNCSLGLLSVIKVKLRLQSDFVAWVKLKVETRIDTARVCGHPVHVFGDIGCFHVDIDFFLRIAFWVVMFRC